jgi:hypothetical protein
VLLSILTLLWQLFVLFGCCFGVGLPFRFLIPKEFSPLQRVLFSLLGGLYLVALRPQNLVYLGVPVRISAWFILGVALIQAWLYRHKLAACASTLYSNEEVRTLGVVILLTITLHGVVPIRQGLEWYYGKGHFDQINYVLLAEFLKEEPYSTSEQDIGLRPWLVRPVGFTDPAEQFGTSAIPRQEMTGLKKVRLGQSIVTAEMCTWSGSDGKAGYAATVIFFLTLLAICIYVYLREIGIDPLMAGSGALLAALLPAVTRLSLNGFLSQASILFIFPFFGILLRQQSLSARSFTLFFGLTLAFVVAAYSEIAPLGLCTLFLGVIWVRHDKPRTKRLIFMSAILLIALVNPFYLRNLVEFLGQQYYFAANATFLDKLAPNLLTLRGWSELIFGEITSAPVALIFDLYDILVGILFLAGLLFLSRRDRLIFGTILLPGLLVILYLATRNPPSYYPIAKITLSILPFVICLVFVAPPRLAAYSPNRPIGMLKSVISAFIVVGAIAGSARYYSDVLNNEGTLRYVRDPHLLAVCRELEKIKNKRVLIFETHPLLTSWLCYHARHSDVYFGGRFISDSAVPRLSSFSKIPDLVNIDFVATRDRIVDLRAPNVTCLTLVENPSGEDWRDGHLRYWLGPPAALRFLALRSMSANLKMRLARGPDATTLPVDYFLADDQGHVAQGEIQARNVEIKRMNFPRGLSALELSVKAKESDPNAGPSFPFLAELDGIEISDIEATPGK